MILIIEGAKTAIILPGCNGVLLLADRFFLRASRPRRWVPTAGVEAVFIPSSAFCALEREGDRGQDVGAIAFQSSDGTLSFLANNEAGNYRSLRRPGSRTFMRDCTSPPFIAQARVGNASSATFPGLYASPLDANGDCYLGGAFSRPGSCWQNATSQSGGEVLGLYSPNVFQMAVWAMEDVANDSSGTVFAFGQATLYGNGAVNPLLPGCWASCAEGTKGVYFQYIVGLVSHDGGRSYEFVNTSALGAGVFVPSQRFNDPIAGNTYISGMVNIVQYPNDSEPRRDTGKRDDQ
jgi:hypothetical protein